MNESLVPWPCFSFNGAVISDLFEPWTLLVALVAEKGGLGSCCVWEGCLVDDRQYLPPHVEGKELWREAGRDLCLPLFLSYYLWAALPLLPIINCES